MGKSTEDLRSLMSFNTLENLLRKINIMEEVFRYTVMETYAFVDGMMVLVLQATISPYGVMVYLE